MSQNRVSWDPVLTSRSAPAARQPSPRSAPLNSALRRRARAGRPRAEAVRGRSGVPRAASISRTASVDRSGTRSTGLRRATRSRECSDLPGLGAAAHICCPRSDHRHAAHVASTREPALRSSSRSRSSARIALLRRMPTDPRWSSEYRVSAGRRVTSVAGLRASVPTLPGSYAP
jgi:hypothetical protein